MLLDKILLVEKRTNDIVGVFNSPESAHLYAHSICNNEKYEEVPYTIWSTYYKLVDIVWEEDV